MADDRFHLGFDALLDYLRDVRHFDTSAYRRTALERRVQRRMRAVGATSVDAYLDRLQVDPDEHGALLDAIVVKATGFFRDPAAWAYVRDKVVAPMLSRGRPGAPVRVWSAGCASGEEAYSLAILFAEAAGGEPLPDVVKVFATDIDDDALERARTGRYDDRALRAVPAELRTRYFERAGDKSAVRDDLRQALVFGHGDLLHDAPIAHVDLLVCRNVLIYLTPEAQALVLHRFHGVLDDDGVLFTGRADTLPAGQDWFRPENARWRIYRNIPGRALRGGLEQLDARAHLLGGFERSEHAVRLLEEAEDALPVAHLVLGPDHAVELANARARRLFGLTHEHLGRHVADLDRSHMPEEIVALVTDASAARRPRHQAALRWESPAEGRVWIDVDVTPLGTPGGTWVGAAITILDVARGARRDTEAELRATRARLEAVVVELQATTEELAVGNEEFETTNQELQTMNLELQDLNDALAAANSDLEGLNTELGARNVELDRVNGFLETILGALHVAVAVVDRDRRVDLWNPAAEELWEITGTHALGRSITDLDSALPTAVLERGLDQALAADPTGTEARYTNGDGDARTISFSFLPLVGPDADARGAIILMTRAPADPDRV